MTSKSVFLTLNQFKQKQLMEKLHHGFAPSPYGLVSVFMVDEHLCGLGFEVSQSIRAAGFPFTYVAARNDELAQKMVERILTKQSVPLLLVGTPFQHLVWQNLLQVKQGERINYQELARRVGDIRKTRAVASAVARNPVSWIVPCHRIIPKSGGIGQYLWGPTIKEKLLTAETES